MSQKFIKKYLIVDTNDEGFAHDYDVILTENEEGHTVYTMYRSKTHWSDENKGEKVLEVVDDGNGVTFKPRVTKEMDYSELAELYIMLTVISKASRIPIYQGEVIETIEVCKIS